jgi:phage-related protein
MGGSSEVLQKYGVDIRETTLKQMALNQGLVENTTDILPPLILAQLIQQAITEQAADAMGDAERTSGSWANSLRGLTGKIKDAATAAGTQLLPVMTPLLNLVGDLAAQAIPVLTSAFEGLLPMLQTGAEIIRQFIGNLQEGMSPIDAFIEAVWDFFPQEVLDRMVDIRDNIIPTIMAKIQEFLTPIQAAVAGFFEWKDVLIALALVLAGVVLSAIISVVTALGPILLALGAIVAAVAIVRQVWENDWLGIRTALEGVWLFLQPTLQTLWEWLQVNIPAAIEVLRGFWEDTLLPAIKAVWEFLSTYVIPVFRAIVEVWLAALQLGLTALAGIWQNVLLPAITAVWSFIKDKLGPVFEWLKSKVIDPVVSSFGGLEGKISSVLGWLGRLRDSLDSITLPDWMTPGSPTPWELGLRGVRDELQALYRGDLPALSASMQGLQNISNRTQNVNQTTNIYTSRVDTRQESAASVRFALGGI